jgi:hypothetical protein
MRSDQIPESATVDSTLTEERLLPLVRDGNWNLIRADIDPFRDYGQLLPNDEVLVVTEAYTGDPVPAWCRVTSIAPGTAAVYPIRVQIPERGEGQYALPELLGWRRPLWAHQALLEGRKRSGLPVGEEAAIAGMMAT